MHHYCMVNCKLTQCLELINVSGLDLGFSVNGLAAEQPQLRDHQQCVYVHAGAVASCMEPARL